MKFTNRDKPVKYLSNLFTKCKIRMFKIKINKLLINWIQSILLLNLKVILNKVVTSIPKHHPNVQVGQMTLVTHPILIYPLMKKMKKLKRLKINNLMMSIIYLFLLKMMKKMIKK